MTNLQIIKEAVWKANPSILELKFGCRVKTNIYPSYPISFTVVKEEYKTEVLVCVAHNEDHELRFIHKDYVKIVGRPIHLADVLLAIKYKERKTNEELKEKIESLGGRKDVEYPLFYNVMMVITKHDMDGGEFWKLSDDNLDHQSPETIDFIANLLK